MLNLLKLNILLLSIFTFLISCDIDQTKEAKLPDVDVDVDVKSGQLPSFDVDWADVNVGTRTTKVTVPKLVIVQEEVEVEVPYVDIDLPNGQEKEEMSLIVEAEVKDEMHDINIKEVYASQNNIFVISYLDKTGDKLDGNQVIRVSDRLVINAPELNVKHYIIGERPKTDHNRQFRYIKSKSKIGDKLKNAKLIYKK